MKILAKAWCDDIYHQDKTSLLGVFQQIFVPDEEKSAHLRGKLYVSLAFDESDDVKKRAHIRVFIQNSKGKEISELFSKNLVEHASERGINLLLATETEKKPVRKMPLGKYGVWITVNDEDPQWVTDFSLVHRDEGKVSRKRK